MDTGGEGRWYAEQEAKKQKKMLLAFMNISTK